MEVEAMAKGEQRQAKKKEAQCQQKVLGIKAEDRASVVPGSTVRDAE